jgi:hypothetical protein
MQSDKEARDFPVVETADPPTNSLASDVEPSPAISSANRSASLDQPSPHLCIHGHLADDDSGMFGRKRIDLDNHLDTRLAIFASCRNSHDVAAFHRASYSETDPIHRIASDSRAHRDDPTTRAERLAQHGCTTISGACLRLANVAHEIRAHGGGAVGSVARGGTRIDTHPRGAVLRCGLPCTCDYPEGGIRDGRRSVCKPDGRGGYRRRIERVESASGAILISPLGAPPSAR